MSPSRPAPRGYRTPRRRQEVIVAALGVALILAVAVALIWALAPHADQPMDTSPVVPQTPATTSTTGPTTSTSSTTPG